MIRSKWTALLMAGILSISSIGMPVFAAESGMAEELPDEIIEEPEETIVDSDLAGIEESGEVESPDEFTSEDDTDYWIENESFEQADDPYFESGEDIESADEVGIDPEGEAVTDQGYEENDSAIYDGLTAVLDDSAQSYLPYEDDQTSTDDLFSQYVNEIMEIPEEKGDYATDGLSGAASKKKYALSNLTSIERAIYDYISSEVPKIASGERTSTIFEIPVSEMGFEQMYWSAGELGVDSIMADEMISQEAADALLQKGIYDLGKVIGQLLVDQPYYMYWLDKTIDSDSSPYEAEAIYDEEKGEYLLGFSGSVRIYCPVVEDYSAGEYLVDETTGQTVRKAAENAKDIVSLYSSNTDYEKLDGYREEICNLTSYNYDALGEDVRYGNPWQLIWVFDEDPNTNVVCEGYAKAFQYLCNLSTFSEGISCITVTGTMAGGTGAGPHMWNIVRMEDGINYLVDLTNCDEGTIGEGNMLFLAGGRIQEGQVGEADEELIIKIPKSMEQAYYQYDGETIQKYNADCLKISRCYYSALKNWTFFASDSFSGGDGTETSPYQISSAEELALMALNVNEQVENYNSCYYELINDIDLYGHEWFPIGNADFSGDLLMCDNYSNYFYGSFNGNGHTVKNMTISHFYKGIYYYGLFGVVYGDIRNVKLENAKIVINETETMGNIDSPFGFSFVTVGTLAGSICPNSWWEDEDNHYLETINIIIMENNTSIDYDIAISTSSHIQCGGLVGEAIHGKLLKNEARGSLNVASEKAVIAGGFGGVIAGCSIEECAFYGTVRTTNDGMLTDEEKSDSIDPLIDQYTYTHCSGGFSGSFGEGTQIVICKDCCAVGSITSSGLNTEVRAGGFVGEMSAIKDVLFMSNCYSNVSIEYSDQFGDYDTSKFFGRSILSDDDLAPGWYIKDCFCYDGNNLYLVNRDASVPNYNYEINYLERKELPIERFSDYLSDKLGFNDEKWIIGDDHLPILRGPHSYNNIFNITDSTCEKQGSMTLQCDNCGAFHNVELLRKPHEVDSWDILKPATCTKNGFKEGTCTRCGKVTEVIRAIGFHYWQVGSTFDVEPTCTQPGRYSVHCTVCDETKEETECPAAGHMWADDFTVDKPATCTEEGSKAIHCFRCDEVKDSEVIPPTGHHYSEWAETKAPTCTETGLRERICWTCNEKETEIIPTIDHAWNEDFTIDKPATCTEAGSKSIHCNECGETKDVTEIPPADHQFGEWETVSSSSCEGTGIERRICTVCGYVETKNLNPSGHSWEESYRIDKPATCTEAGSKSIHCLKCEAVKDSEVIPATGHHYGEWAETKTPTCTATGLRERICTICNEKETEVIPAIGHEWNEEFTIDTPVTCTDAGSKSIHCSKCEAVKDSEVIPATGHHYDECAETKAPTCTEAGVRERICTTCNEKETEVVPATGHEWSEEFTVDKPATCAEMGSKSIHCLKCDATKENQSIPIIDHHVTVTKGKSATCTTSGLTDGKKCSECGIILSPQKAIKALGHSWSSWKVTKAASTTVKGEKTRTCSRCKAKEKRAIAKLPKKAQPMTVGIKKITIKKEKVKKKKQTIAKNKAFVVNNAQGPITFEKVNGSGKLSISKAGKVTVKKGTKKGTYKMTVKVTAAGNKDYKSGSKTVKLKMKVK